MQANLISVINVAAIAVMLVCLYMVFTLRSKIPGGVVGKQWRLLTVLVTLIFFFGAIYVLITVRLIFRIIEELTS